MDLVAPLMTLLDNSYSFIAKRVDHVKKFKKNMDSLVAKLEVLKEAREDLVKEAKHAELVGKTSTNQVKGWLERAQKAEAEVNDIVLDQPKCRSGVCCGRVTWSKRYKLSKKALRKET
ncbi:hypothetical protein vseg_000697 [Gypsophila vaccaria]